MRPLCSGILAFAGLAFPFLTFPGFPFAALTLALLTFAVLAFAVLALAGVALAVPAFPGLTLAVMMCASVDICKVLVRRVDPLHLPGDFLPDLRRARLMPVRMPDLRENEVTFPNLRDRRFTCHAEKRVRILSVRKHGIHRIL